MTLAAYKKRISDNWFLMTELVKKGIRLKYRRSYLGILWSLIEPILTTIILVIVFGTILHRKEADFPLYIITGRLIYSFYSSGSKAGCTAIRRNAGMIKKVYVPKYLYPISSCLFNYVIFLISLSVAVLVMLYCRVAPTFHIWQVIPALVFLLGFTIGSGLVLATINVFFRDVEYLWNVALLMIMYLSAIFYYPDALLESKWGFIIRLNPLYCIIDIFRGGMMGYLAPTWDFAYAFCAAAASIAVGIAVFRWKQEDFVFQL